MKITRCNLVKRVNKFLKVSIERNVLSMLDGLSDGDQKFDCFKDRCRGLVSGRRSEKY